MSHSKRLKVVTRLLFIGVIICLTGNGKNTVFGATLNESSGSNRHSSSLIHNTVATKEMLIDESPAHRHPESTSSEEHNKKKGHEMNYLLDFLADMKTGTKVFQHFYMHSNLTKIVEDGSYTILIPSDNAFQRWHPIDWGFYPFNESVKIAQTRNRRWLKIELGWFYFCYEEMKPSKLVRGGYCGNG
uniref:CSON009791 protein n=1 Tax=Culicoides sonorensis TaxID=179676 RepID=A0A336LGZ8_CULSO